MADNNWTFLGPIVKTQIHTDRMTSSNHYASEMLLDVDQLHLNESGLVGVVNGAAILHGHHQLHPNKYRQERPRKFRPKRLLSIGFTSHYEAMNEYFGEAPIGCGAEDLIVSTSKRIELKDIAGGVQIRSDSGSVDLLNPQVAKPCVPFSSYMLRSNTSADVQAALKFLSGGMRGFVLGAATISEPVSISVGNELWVQADAACGTPT